MKCAEKANTAKQQQQQNKSVESETSDFNFFFTLVKHTITDERAIKRQRRKIHKYEPKKKKKQKTSHISSSACACVLTFLSLFYVVQHHSFRACRIHYQKKLLSLRAELTNSSQCN